MVVGLTIIMKHTYMRYVLIRLLKRLKQYWRQCTTSTVKKIAPVPPLQCKSAKLAQTLRMNVNCGPNWDIWNGLDVFWSSQILWRSFPCHSSGEHLEGKDERVLIHEATPVPQTPGLLHYCITPPLHFINRKYRLINPWVVNSNLEWYRGRL